MIINTVLLLLGFVILIKGADILVKGSSGLAERFKVPKILIGLTIVAFGTSMPELAVCMKSIMMGSGDIALGNIIGGNTLNVFLILGCCAIIHPLVVQIPVVKRELPIVMIVSILLGILLSDNLLNSQKMNMITRVDGMILLLFFLVFVYYLITMFQNKEDYPETEEIPPLKKCLLFITIGLIGVICGSHLVVDAAVKIAQILQVSERMISLTILALGTSLPELVTGIASVKNGEYDLVIGNIVGSNILNIGGVIGLSATILGGTGPVTFSYIDLIAMIVSAILLFMASFNDYKISKKEGIIFIILFITYYAYVLTS
ncbi:MAG: calcium/sodium antiporter [Bacilli bacterium]|nr:calcium/sodium antiporter [Bacilli bacterium]